MAFASLDAYADAGILEASIGIPAGQNPYWGQRARVLVIAQDALQQLADNTSKDDTRRHLLQKSFSIALTNGIGPIDSTMLSAAIGYGSVMDADTSAPNQVGNILVQMGSYNDLVRYQYPFYGYYAMVNDQIYTKQISSASLTDTIGPLTAFCSYVPLATEIPAELQNDAVSILAGLIKKMPA